MTMLPQLHPTQLLSDRHAGVRQLRLVSKDVCAVATSAVTSCTVHLGVGLALPDPHQLVKLMGRGQQQLACLSVIVTVASGAWW